MVGPVNFMAEKPENVVNWLAAVHQVVSTARRAWAGPQDASTSPMSPRKPTTGVRAEWHRLGPQGSPRSTRSPITSNRSGLSSSKSTSLNLIALAPTPAAGRYCLTGLDQRQLQCGRDLWAVDQKVADSWRRGWYGIPRLWVRRVPQLCAVP